MTFVAHLAQADDWSAFAQALSRVLTHDIAPDKVQWSIGAPTDTGAMPGCQPSPTVLAPLPLAFIETAKIVLLHTDPSRHWLLHRMAQRLHANAATWLDTLHPEHVALMHWHRQVRRDIHKMKAFVRFTRVGDQATERYVAWFEPQHRIVRAVAPFFARRFTGMRWTILTPDASVQWDGQALTFGAGANKQDAPPADADERLWLTYYQRIFNPARVKVRAMRHEMPVRYWTNLPEARLIAPLLRQASQRTHAMVSHQDVTRDHRSGVCAPSPVDASAPDALQRLMHRASTCDACDFACHATQTVWGEGRAGAPLMIVGEQPGDREDLEGRPFIGPAGVMLREAMQRLGWLPSQVYLTNAVKHFKYTWRGKRRMHKTAAQREVDACATWLDAEVAAVQPKALLALGNTAAASLLGRPVRLGEVLGTWQQSRHGLPVWVAPHPSALLRAGIDVHSHAFERWTMHLSQARVPPVDGKSSPLSPTASACAA